jgi:4-diphosphocytidyl-2-C-methyl-D-erythritol kinase
MSSFEPLRALAPAKINLGLFVGPLRERDGKHELASVMQSISLSDELTLSPAPDAAADELVCPGVDGAPERNLAMRALRAFRRSSGWDAGPVRLEVVKRVPVAAGLGGGSGDAAATLRLAMAASGRGEQAMLQELAADLGADVPAQVRPGRWLARGAGEDLLELSPPSSELGVLVFPDPHELSTAAVYAALDRHWSLRSETELDRLSRALRKALEDGQALPPLGLLGNDLQAPALSLCHSIAESLHRARLMGAEAAILSGSGPTVLGLYAGPDGPARAQRAAEQLAGQGLTALAARSVDASYGQAMPATA